MRKPLDELYFEWLYSQVGDTSLSYPSKTYWGLLRQMYVKEFVWFVPNDDNRVEDGKYLRRDFVDDLRLINVDAGWLDLGCSMLELLVGLARRLSFEAGGESRDWFWHLVNNIEIRFNDIDYKECPTAKTDIDDALDRVIWRTYSPDGDRGLFPLMNPQEDQRKVELWYQLCAYVLEQV
jgi:hypothetical protein